MILGPLLLFGCLDGHLDAFESQAVHGGAAGSGGTPAAGTGGSGGTPAAVLLDDFEDQDNAVEPDGWWYVTDDGTGPEAIMSFDAISGRGASRFGAHLAAGPTTGFGAFLGLDLPGGVFDGTDYAELTFFARMSPAGELSVRFQDPLGTQYQQIVELGTDWQEFRLPIDAFVSTDDDTPINPAELTHLQLWLVDDQPAFDFYVDDVWLVRTP